MWNIHNKWIFGTILECLVCQNAMFLTLSLVNKEFQNLSINNINLFHLFFSVDYVQSIPKIITLCPTITLQSTRRVDFEMNWTSNLRTLYVEKEVQLRSAKPECVASIQMLVLYATQLCMLPYLANITHLKTNQYISTVEWSRMPNLSHLEYFLRNLNYDSNSFPHLKHLTYISNTIPFSFINIPTVTSLHVLITEENAVLLQTWVQLNILTIEINGRGTIIVPELLNSIRSLIHLTHLTIHCQCWVVEAERNRLIQAFGKLPYFKIYT